MADHLTEEEQVEALKRWWNENWLSVVAPIVILLGGYLAWNSWDGYKTSKAQEASSQYQELMSLLEVSPGEEVSKEKKLSATDIANNIIDGYSGGMYANMSSLLLAKFAVEEGNLDKAADIIKTVVDEPANASVGELAKTRLARVLAAQQKYDQALGLVVSTSESAYKSLMAEIRGDIYVAQGNLSLARTAYQEALDNLSMEQYARRGLVQIKFDNTGSAEADSAETQPVEGDA